MAVTFPGYLLIRIRQQSVYHLNHLDNVTGKSKCSHLDVFGRVVFCDATFPGYLSFKN